MKRTNSVGLDQRHHDQRHLLAASAACVALALVALFLRYGGLIPLNGLSSSVVAASDGYSSPLKITKGGTYTGRWKSTDRGTPSVSIETGEPVVIENAEVTGPGNLIWANCNCAEGIHLTVKNVTGTETDSGVVGASRGNFITVSGAKSLEVAHTTMSGVFCGVAVVNSVPDLLKIDNNSASNVEDRQSDGQGGVLRERGTGHVVILTNVVAARGAEIAWNQFINEPGKASVEDMISVYNSQGASSDLPIDVHDNYLEGAVSTLGAGYAGGGILTDGDGAGSDAPGVTAFVNIHDNQVVSTENYGIAIAAGHNVSVHDNRVVSSGRTTTGAWLGVPGFGSPVAYYLWNFYRSADFHDNRMTRNGGALVKPDASGMPMRSDMDARSLSANLHNIETQNVFRGAATDSSIPTRADEAGERTAWLKKLSSAHQAAGVPVGVQP